MPNPPTLIRNPAPHDETSREQLSSPQTFQTPSLPNTIPPSKRIFHHPPHPPRHIQPPRLDLIHPAPHRMFPRINPHRRILPAHLADEHELQTRARGRIPSSPPTVTPRERIDLADDASDAQARFLEDLPLQAVQEARVRGFDVAAGDGEEVREGGVVGRAFEEEEEEEKAGFGGGAGGG